MIKMVLLLFCSFNIFSEVIDLQVLDKKKFEYDFKEICTHFYQNHSLLIDVKNQDELDCMGKIVSLKQFCLDKWKDSEEVLRGYVDKKENKGICLLGKRVVLKYKCLENDQFCQNQKIGCEKMKSILSYQLNTLHSSMTSDNSLNCIFEKESEISQNDLIKNAVL